MISHILVCIIVTPLVCMIAVPVHPAHCSVCSLFGVPIVPYSPNLGEEDGCDIIQVGVDNFTHCERDKGERGD